MELLHERQIVTPIRAALFDFDGTVSTLRYGWEAVMRPLMLEMISGHGAPYDAALEAEVDAYIDESTGIQTILQMKWLAQRVLEERPNDSMSDDPWWYKAEYNRRLMETVNDRLERLESGAVNRENYLIAGSEAFLKALKARGVRIFVASGTDDPDVHREAAALGVDGYFDRIAGAPLGVESCSKEKVLRDLVEKEGLSGADVAVFGDGKVEIALGASIGARTVGTATDEEHRCGVNPVKRERLVKAGADVLVGDFAELNALLAFLGL